MRERLRRKRRPDLDFRKSMIHLGLPCRAGYTDSMTYDSSFRRAQALLWLTVLVWAGIIFAFSATPNLRVAPTADLDFVIRKAGHMAVFGVLAVLVWRALASSTVRRAMVWSLVLTAAYAATDEFHQSFTSGRHPSAVDVGIDSVGAPVSY